MECTEYTALRMLAFRESRGDPRGSRKGYSLVAGMRENETSKNPHGSALDASPHQHNFFVNYSGLTMKCISDSIDKVICV